MSLNLIYDRTELDVQNETSKGFYHDTDMNRVGEVVNTIAELLNRYGYTVDVTGLTGWEATDDITQENIAAYKDNIRLIREAYPTKPDTPLYADVDMNFYWGWNNLEKILSDVYDLLTEMEKSFLYCNDTYCGEGSYD